MQRPGRTSISAHDGVVEPCSHACDPEAPQSHHKGGHEDVCARGAGHPALAVQVAAPNVQRAALRQRTAVPGATGHLPALHQCLSFKGSAGVLGRSSVLRRVFTCCDQEAAAKARACLSALLL